jgi:two-component system, chemotaxis family, chemotaxis protein CheY
MTYGKPKQSDRNAFLDRFPYETKILLAEDTKITRDIVHRMLYKLGYSTVVEVRDGEGAWYELEKTFKTGRPYGLILADWKMPRLSGLELLRRVRSHPVLKETPFIMLTTNIRQEHVLQAAEAGVDNYLAKPFVIDILERKMTETWRKVHKSPLE